jgi:hypothetical protein
MRSLFQRSVEAAVCEAVDFLLEQQDRDGFWREFDLQPGASEAWTTAWVGWCLCRMVLRERAQRARIRESCRRAAAALRDSRIVGGWGYNRRAGPDADTTSWVLRFLSACGFNIEPIVYLGPHVDSGGGVHTFRELDFGSWTDAHDDVAANAGLALLTASTSQHLALRIRQRLVRRFPGKTYWWATPTYGVAWSLRFLTASGGLPHAIRSLAGNWIGNLPESVSSFEVAHRIIAVVETTESRSSALPLINQLLDLARPNGWEGSSFLLVPPRGPENPSQPNPEVQGLLTTAICARVLSEWIDLPLPEPDPSKGHPRTTEC